MSDSQLDALCVQCDFAGEDRRRFLRATRNLAEYTRKWTGITVCMNLFFNYGIFII